jgi:hypothetical protein
VIDQDASHDLRRDGEEMRTIGPVNIPLIDEANVSLIDQSGGLESVAFSFPAHVAPREPVQFVVDQGVQLVECGLISLAPLSEQFGNLVLRSW